MAPKPQPTRNPSSQPVYLEVTGTFARVFKRKKTIMDLVDLGFPYPIAYGSFLEATGEARHASELAHHIYWEHPKNADPACPQCQRESKSRKTGQAMEKASASEKYLTHRKEGRRVGQAADGRAS